MALHQRSGVGDADEGGYAQHLSPDDRRFRSTLYAVEEGLRRGSHMLRYAVEEDFGLPHTAFNVCTFWLIEALHATGRITDALTGDELWSQGPHVPMQPASVNKMLTTAAALLTLDRDAGTLTGRPGAGRLAVTSGGAIPDRGLFGVFLVHLLHVHVAVLLRHKVDILLFILFLVLLVNIRDRRLDAGPACLRRYRARPPARRWPP